MKVTYYPGCSLQGTARDYAESIHGVCATLDIELEEIPDWNCCGVLIPAITHQTPPKERKQILRNFMKGTYNRIVTSRVLDEGVDVPDASMAVIISGTGSKRQFIQRLGRILRKQPGKQAILYELVSTGTAETYMSRRRKR